MVDTRQITLNEVTNPKVNCRRLLMSYIYLNDADVINRHITSITKCKKLIIAHKDNIIFVAVDFGEKFVNRKVKNLNIFDIEGIHPKIYAINGPSQWAGLMSQLGVIDQN